MKRTWIHCIAALALALCATTQTARALDKGEEAPNFRFEASWGVPPGAQQLTDLRGQIVFIEVWKIH
ncbi:MAG: hypothetical protein AB7K09_05900 [Planctomycetota bacterium]